MERRSFIKGLIGSLLVVPVLPIAARSPNPAKDPFTATHPEGDRAAPAGASQRLGGILRHRWEWNPCPFRFKDEFCTYSGPEKNCDKNYKGCKVKKRYGGGLVCRRIEPGGLDLFFVVR